MLRHFVWYIDVPQDVSQDHAGYILIVERSVIEMEGADSTEIWRLFT
jgi:hypothetical protein